MTVSPRSSVPPVLFASLCAGIVMVYLDTTVVNVALPILQRDFGADIRQLQWVIDAYTLIFASLLLAAGTLGDIIGRNRVFVGGFLGFTAASAICAAAPSISLLLLGRGLQGACAAIMIPLSLAMISTLYADRAARARAIGIWAGLGGLALAAGPVIGGIFVERLGWRSIFLLNLPIGIIAALCLARRLPANSAARARKLDVVGLVLFVTGTGLLTYSLIEGNELGWASPAIVASFASALVALVAFLLWERRQDDALLPLGLFRNPVLVAACVVNFVALFGLFAVLFTLTLFFQQVQQRSAFDTGLCFLALTIPIMVASYVASAIAGRIGPKIPIVAGALLVAVGLTGLTTIEVGSSFVLWGWALTLIGTGVSFVGAPASVAVLASVPPAQAGTVSGVFNTFRQVGAVFGVALPGALILHQMNIGLSAALDGVHLPPDTLSHLVDALTKGRWSALAALAADQRAAVIQGAGGVFLQGLRSSLWVAAGGTVVGAAVAACLLRQEGASKVPGAVQPARPGE